MPAFTYRYELRRGEEVVATGHLTEEQVLKIGDRIVIGGLVRVIDPALGEHEFRLVVELLRGGIDS